MQLFAVLEVAAAQKRSFGVVFALYLRTSRTTQSAA